VTPFGDQLFSGHMLIFYTRQNVAGSTIGDSETSSPPFFIYLPNANLELWSASFPNPRQLSQPKGDGGLVPSSELGYVRSVITVPC